MVDQTTLQDSRPRTHGAHTRHQGKDQTVNTAFIPDPHKVGDSQAYTASTEYNPIQALFQAIS